MHFGLVLAGLGTALLGRFCLCLHGNGECLIRRAGC